MLLANLQKLFTCAKKGLSFNRQKLLPKMSHHFQYHLVPSVKPLLLVQQMMKLYLVL